jgi:hypothetical protein
MEGEKRRTPSLHHWKVALSKGPNIIVILLFSPSIHLKTEAEPASEMS